MILSDNAVLNTILDERWLNEEAGGWLVGCMVLILDDCSFHVAHV